MLGLHEEFLPASALYEWIIFNTWPLISLAGLGFGATQMLGENEGELATA